MDLRNCDNMELMKQFEDKHFDLAIVDPPYGINWTESINYSEKQKVHQNNKGYKTHSVKDWDKAKPTKEYWDELFRVSKNQIVWGGNYFADCLPISRCWIVWDKKGENFTAINNELAWTSFTTKIKVFGRVHGMDKGFMNKDGGGIHPTEKPVQLYKFCLKHYAKQGDKILDTHLGGGSIAIAVDNVNKIDGLNLTLTASEIDKEYFDKAMKRIRNATMQESISFNH
jgi:site-specific DNA-methyltransferase (adenine-specific)